jgi:hypothetical protein
MRERVDLIQAGHGIREDFIMSRIKAMPSAGCEAQYVNGAHGQSDPRRSHT